MRLIFFALLLLFGCGGKKYLTHKEKMKYIKTIEQTINVKTKTNYGDIILKHDLLGLDSRSNNSCPFSAHYIDLLTDRTDSKVEFERKVNRTIKMINNKKIDQAEIAKRIDSKINKMNGIISSKKLPKLASAKLKKPKGERLFEKLEHLKHISTYTTKIPVSQPIIQAQITSDFKKRVDPISKKLKKHEGVDLFSSYSKKILASGDGIIKFVGYDKKYGNLVIVDHGNGYSTRYAHLDRVMVKKGDVVILGQFLGISGDTGRTTGEHLHYEVRYNNIAYDPKLFMHFSANCL